MYYFSNAEATTSITNTVKAPHCSNPRCDATNTSTNGLSLNGSECPLIHTEWPCSDAQTLTKTHNHTMSRQAKL